MTKNRVKNQKFLLGPIFNLEVTRIQNDILSTAVPNSIVIPKMAVLPEEFRFSRACLF